MRLLRKIDADLLAAGRFVARLLAGWCRVSSGQAAALLFGIAGLAIVGWALLHYSTHGIPGVLWFSLVAVACWDKAFAALGESPETHAALRSVFTARGRLVDLLLLGPWIAFIRVAPLSVLFCYAVIAANYILNARMKPQPLAVPEVREAA